MTTKLTLDILKTAISSKAAAFRCRRRLQPGGGEGDKVFPPTFAGAVYAVEQRKVAGREQPVTCVLMDSVQSQANRMELALQEALDSQKIQIPVLNVDFSDSAPTGDVEADKLAGRLLDDVGIISSLQAPHRIADAILRDSEFEGQPFRTSEKGRALNVVSNSNATPLFQLCPTALLFGMWDSTGPKGGLGPKFERAMVSEIVGIGAEFGLKTQSRIDPLISATKGIVLYKKKGGGWTLDEASAEIKDGKPQKLGKEGKVSEANLGNVTPGFHKYGKGAEGFDPLQSGKIDINYSIKSNADEFQVKNQSRAEAAYAREKQIAPGGVTIEYAEQLTTLSLICLRRLLFPVAGQINTKADQSAQTVLAALGLCAATLAFESGMDLRSRCLLWPEDVMEWELLKAPGQTPEKYSLNAEEAIALLNAAIQEAKGLNLPWEENPITLKPSAELIKLVQKSQLEAVKDSSDEGE